MRKLTSVLVTVAVGLTVACAYLANEIQIERGRTRAEAHRRQELQTRLQQIEGAPQAAARRDSGLDALRAGSPAGEISTQSTPPARDVASPGNKESSFDDGRAWRQKLLKDPAGRELLRAQQRAELHAENPNLPRDLGLTTEEYDRLLGLLAEQALQRTELIVKEAGTLSGDKLDELRSNHEQEVANLLGVERAQQYKEYIATQPVRAQVAQLRARLTEDNALRADQSARLVTALQEQRVRFEQDLREQYSGENVTQTMGTWYGGSFMASDTRDTSAEEQFLAQIEDYNGRLIRSASSVLTPTQLEVFSTLQDERLAYQRVELRTDAETLGE